MDKDLLAPDTTRRVDRAGARGWSATTREIP